MRSKIKTGKIFPHASVFCLRTCICVRVWAANGPVYECYILNTNKPECDDFKY